MKHKTKILAIETATEAFSVALQIGDEVKEVFQLAPQQHAVLLLPTIQRLLSEAEVKLNQLDLLAFGCGPGSFTSIRLAASAAQGLAFASDLQVAAVPTLQALAQGGRDELCADTVLVGLDARMHEIYLGMYKIGNYNIMQPCCDDMLVKSETDTTVKLLQSQNFSAGSYLCVGNAWDVYKNELPSSVCEAHAAAKKIVYPRASYIAKICHLAYASENASEMLKIGSWKQAVPVYLRDKVAFP